MLKPCRLQYRIVTDGQNCYISSHVSVDEFPPRCITLSLRVSVIQQEVNYNYNGRRLLCDAKRDQMAIVKFLVTSDKGEVNVLPVFVCLSVCLLARLLKNAYMDLDEMLHADSCRDMDELINF